MTENKQTVIQDSPFRGAGGLQYYLEQRHPASTVKAYLRDIDIFLKRHPKAKDYRYTDVMGYLGELRRRYSNVQSLHRTLQAVKKYYRYLCYSGQRKDNPAQSIRLRDYRSKPVQLQDLFSSEELQRLLEPRAERYAFLALRNQVILSLLVYQGLKAGEIVSLETGSVRLKEGNVLIAATGNTHKRVLALQAQQVMLLHEYLMQARERLMSGRTLGCRKLLLSKTGTALSISEVQYLVETFRPLFPERRLTATAVRQSVIRNMLDAGGDIRAVQVFAGHLHPATTEQYRRTQIETLKTEIEKYHPLQ
jgi:integrase/recombinase XerD